MLLLSAGAALLPVGLTDEPGASLEAMSPTARPIHRDIAADAGLGSFLHAGWLGSPDPDVPEPVFTEITGPGACWIDVDGDGFLDVYLVNGLFETEPEKNEVLDPHSMLFRNRGDGTFEDATSATGSRLVGTYQGCAAADYDDDGWTDLFVTGWRGSVLFRNTGGVLVDVAESSGVRDRDCGDFACWASSASWLDYDLDGCLDLFVNHFTDFDPENPPVPISPGPGQVNRLYRSLCDGTFADTTAEAGLDDVKHDSWSSVAADISGDGWTDLYVSNDGDPKDLYFNNGDGTFTRDVDSVTADDYRGGMGTDVADLNQDGRWDLITTNWINQDNGIYIQTDDDFDDVGDEAPFTDAHPYSGWGVHAYDENNDGLQDLVVVNGQTHDFRAGLFPLDEPILAYESIDADRFQTVREDVGTDFSRHFVGRGAAFADFDDDGDQDFILAEAGEAPTHLFRADLTGGNFLNVALEGTAPTVTRDAIGARVTVRAEGLADQSQERISGSSYMSSNDPRLHFGLGLAEQAGVEVRWPDGSVETWAGIRANSFVRLTQGAATTEVTRELPIVRLFGPSEGLRLAELTYTATADVPGDAEIAGIAWDFAQGRATADGATATFAADDVGGFSVRATVTDTLGRVKTQGARVLVTDDLEAQITFPGHTYMPMDRIEGTVTVRFSDAAPVSNADVVVRIAPSTGNTLFDGLVGKLPQRVLFAAGFSPVEISGATAADGRFVFEVPYNLQLSTETFEREAHRPGAYRVVVEGGARGSFFDDATTAYVVGAALPEGPQP